uniref:Uncharacterized protein n=1 Tax=Glossina austeni TaxID=7395 RepID=A0A1A9VXP2_GLOAU
MIAMSKSPQLPQWFSLSFRACSQQNQIAAWKENTSTIETLASSGRSNCLGVEEYDISNEMREEKKKRMLKPNHVEKVNLHRIQMWLASWLSGWLAGWLDGWLDG